MHLRFLGSPAARPSRRLRSVAVVGASLAMLAGGAASATASTNPGTGDTGFFTFPASSPDRTVRVNVASGNLLVDTTDVPDGAATYHVTLRRSYNSLAPATDNVLGRRWNFQIDPTVRIIDQGSTAIIAGPSGYRVTATRNGSSAYATPAGFEGILTSTGSGWTLQRPAAGETLNFDSAGDLAGATDGAGRTFTVQRTSAAGRTVLSSFGDQSGRRINLSYNGDAHVRLADDPASGHLSYSYTSGVLSSFSDAANRTASYGYDTNGFLNAITLPSGDAISTTNDASGRVLRFSTSQPGQTAQTTTFDYSTPGTTVVTSPGGDVRRYTYDDDYRVTGAINPNAPAFGDLSDMRGEESPDPDEDYSQVQGDVDETDPSFSSCAADADLPDSSYCYTGDEDADGSGNRAARAAGPNAALKPGGSGWGLADQRAFPLARPEVQALKVKKFRVIVPWDVIRRANRAYDYTCTKGTSTTSDDDTIAVEQDSPSTRGNGSTIAQTDAVIQAAQAKGYDITISFGRTRQGASEDGTVKSAYCYLPTPAIYERWVGAVLDRYPGVKDYTVWNEPNDAGQPTSTAKNKAVGPRRAAQFYKALRSACVDRRRSCRVASPDFLDKPTLTARVTDNGARTACRRTNAPSDCKSYLRRYFENLDGAAPKYWAFHAYVTGSDRSTSVLRNFIKRTQESAPRSGAEYWMTEQGGRAHLNNQGPVVADRDLQYLVNNVPDVDSRITRFYLYNYSGDPKFDSGLADFRFGSEQQGFALRRMYCTYLASTAPGTPCASDPQTDTPNNNTP